MVEKQANAWTAARTSVRFTEPPLDALHSGDRDAFNDLVVMYQSTAYRLAYRILNDPAAAEDATQTAFLDAFRGIHSFHGGSFRAWLLRIVTYTCYDDLRHELRHRSLSLDETLEDEDEPARWLMDPRQPSPEEEAERNELSELVHSQLARLPADLRAVSMLVDLEELDYIEASRRIQCPVGTVKSRLFRSRSALRKSIKAYLETGTRTGLFT